MIVGKSQYTYSARMFSECIGTNDYSCDDFDEFCARLREFYGPSAEFQRSPTSTQQNGQVTVSYSVNAFAQNAMPLYSEWNETCAPLTQELRAIAAAAEKHALACISSGFKDIAWHCQPWVHTLDTAEALAVIKELAKRLDVTHLFIASEDDEPTAVYFGVSGRSQHPELLAALMDEEERDHVYLFVLRSTDLDVWSGIQFDIDDGFCGISKGFEKFKHVWKNAFRCCGRLDKLTQDNNYRRPVPNGRLLNLRPSEQKVTM